MNSRSIDWPALDRLRAAFLAGSAGQTDYWQSENDLASYDQTFAQRIGWKWDYVLAELARRNWSPPQGAVLDWGCGSGIAGRAFLDHFGEASGKRLLTWDRSAMAMGYALKRARQRFPDALVERWKGPDDPFQTLLLSHVLTELNEPQLSELLAIAARATAVLWVEPGTHEASRRLSVIRNRLRDSFQVAAPCTHQCPCPVLLPENGPHWCHHFAAPPPAVFTDGDWARFAVMVGIDLRSLPLSFVVLDKRPQPAKPATAVRVIGRPRVYKAHALLLACDASGLHERRLTKRALPEQFRQLKKDELDPLQILECQGEEIVAAREPGE